MTFPKPWADSDPESLQAELLRAARRQTLGASDRMAVWVDIQARIAEAATTASAGAGSGSAPGAGSDVGASASAGGSSVGAASAGATSLWVKGTWVMLGVLAVGGAGGLAWHLASGPSAANQPAAAVSSLSSTGMAGGASVERGPTIPMAEGSASDAESITDTPATKRRVTPPAFASIAVETSTLREESRMLLEARAALRSKNPTLALELLHRAASRFSHGVLGEEREALMIEALAQEGQRQLAAERAEAFLRHFQRSPHAADVRRYISR
jgi:hypothetical protein